MTTPRLPERYHDPKTTRASTRRRPEAATGNTQRHPLQRVRIEAAQRHRRYGEYQTIVLQSEVSASRTVTNKGTL